MKQRTTIRIITMVAGIAVALNVMTASAFAARSTTTEQAPPPSSAHEKYQCPDEENLNNVTGHGANNNDGYQSTCDEADFGGNGQEFGPGKQTGKPCAGCVGNADDKNPPGQYPDGSDHNSGYECDGRDRPFEGQQGNGNHGIGDENPAHTGCNSTTTPPRRRLPPTRAPRARAGRTLTTMASRRPTSAPLRRRRPRSAPTVRRCLATATAPPVMWMPNSRAPGRAST